MKATDEELRERMRYNCNLERQALNLRLDGRCTRKPRLKKTWLRKAPTKFEGSQQEWEDTNKLIDFQIDMRI